MNSTKIDLCNRISKKLNHKHIKEIKPVIDVLLEEVLTILAEGQKIELRGFGVFQVKTRKARIGRNPRTGETVKINEYRAPVFKFSKEAQNLFDLKLKV